MINRGLLKLFVSVCCLLVAVMAITVIRGWFLQDSSIVQIRPDYVPMQFNAALCFLLTAISIWTLHRCQFRIVLPLALGSLILSSLTGIQYILDVNFGIDTLLVDPFTTVQTSHPGRMAPNTAVNFFLLNIATLYACSSASLKSKTVVSVGFGLVAFAFALVALLGYGTGLAGGLIWGNFTAMAVHTATGFIFLGFALTLAGIDQSELDNIYELPFLPAIASASVLILTILIWFALQTTTSMHIQNLLNNHENEMADDLKNYLNIEGRAVQRMAGRMDLYAQENSSLFNHDAMTYLEDFNDLAGLAWIQGHRDIEYQQIKDRYRELSNIARSFSENLPEAPDLNAPSYDMPHFDGAHPFIRISVPTTLQNQTTGHLVALSSIETLITETLAAQDHTNYVFSVSLNGQTIIGQGENPDPRWISHQTSHFNSIPLTISVKAAPILVQELQSHVPTIFLIAGFLMSLLIGTTLRLFQSSRVLTLKVSETNARLHDSLREVKSSRVALEAKSLALEQSNKDLENFASIAAHDLNEPLRKITIFGERLLSNNADNLDDKGKQYLDVMINGASRMQSLLESLLAYSRVTTKGGEFGKTDLNAVVNDVLSDLEALIEENKVEVLFQNLPTINADYTQMRQLFQNLIANSIRYHKPDVSPVIEIRHDRENALDKQLRITVRDNGIGFDQENADKIFEVFKRLHTRAEFPGTGMGLAVCKRIMERHEGKISAQGEPDKGACFILDFPEQPKSRS